MFRALRELLLSGNIKGLLDGSRRQARLLAQFSPEFGQRASLPPNEFVMNATRARGVPANLTPDDVRNSEALSLGVGFGAQSPFGGAVGIYEDGTRYRPAPNMYSPIVAPYEYGRPINPSYATTKEKEAIAENLRRRYENYGVRAVPAGFDELQYEANNVDLYNILARRYARNKPVPSWWEYPYEAGGLETYQGNIPYHLYPMNEYLSRAPYLSMPTTNPRQFLPIEDIPF